MWNLWNPLNEMDALHRELDRFLRGYRERDPGRAAFLPGRGARQYPRVNISEDQAALYVHALAPGLDTDSIKVTVADDVLSLAGEKPAIRGVANGAFHRSERAAGSFQRSLELPCPVDETRVEAEYKDGILRLVLPKDQRTRPRSIEVKIG